MHVDCFSLTTGMNLTALDRFCFCHCSSFVSSEGFGFSWTSLYCVFCHLETRCKRSVEMKSSNGPNGWAGRSGSMTFARIIVAFGERNKLYDIDIKKDQFPPTELREGIVFSYVCLFTCDHYPWCIGPPCTGTPCTPTPGYETSL